MASIPMDRPSTAVVERPARRWAPSPAIGRGDLVWAIGCGVALALIVTWPLAAHLSTRIAPDLGDPIRTAWEVAWVGHAMLDSPLHLWSSNAFWPHPLSLAFSDSLLGYGPAGFVGSGTVAALVRYNLLFLLAWALCFTGAWLLARELGCGRMGANAAGAAFAYAPYRITEAGHLHVISSGGIPLSLFLLVRGYRRGSRGLLAAGWLVAAWQMSLGFTLGLQFAYLMAALALIAVVWWWRARQGAARRALPGERQHPSHALLGRRDLVALTCIGVALCGAVSVYQARPYLKVADQYPTAKRTLREVKNYSSGPWAFLAASSENRVWGGVTAGAQAHVHSKNEDVFFPGAAILALALVGLSSAVYPRGLRLGLACGALAFAVLALGMGLTGAGYPYRLLYDFAPGWNGVRVPGRVFTMATLFLALLAGAGAERLVGTARAWSAAGLGANWEGRLPMALGALVVVVLVGEGAGHMAHPLVPQPARGEIGLPTPVLNLPTDGASDRLWQYFSTDGFPEIAQGNSTFDIQSLDDLRGGMEGFPDKASVEKLRWWGIKTVVLHLKMPDLPELHAPEIPEPPDPAAAAAKPIRGLGLTGRRVGGLVIYTIGPGPKALHARDR
jgi:hypothetical protein